MKRIFLFFLFITVFQLSKAQVIVETIYSEKLQQERQLKILLPKGYSDTDKKDYPIIVVLDGDYLFELVTGNTDYYSYWEDIPKVIVVGINQADFRYDDMNYSEQNSLPIESGANFFEFIGMEVLPFVQSKFKTKAFKVAVGHGETANFINYYLLKEKPLFNAFICISPDFAPEMPNYLAESLAKIKSKIFYYLATSKNDVQHIKEVTNMFHDKLKIIDNKNVLYNFDEFEAPSHYTMPAHALPKALENIFLVFQPISKKEYTDNILKLEGSPVEYLVEKYQTINDLFGIKKQILVNDFKAIAAAIEKTKNFEYFEPLSKIAKKEYPDAMLGHYYLARFYEQTGEPKKAMRTYQSGYILEEIGGLTKDMMLDKADAIKADFGY
ncbi:alpha/beta hydrolase [Paucihalobacter sp.]|uniref:alpha/beta hydrolase n=1 Tax=Paucihalobacter sp. TaxID=2850405 RepID=UPI002FDF5D7D